MNWSQSQVSEDSPRGNVEESQNHDLSSFVLSQSTMGSLSTNLNMCNFVWKTVLGHWNGANVMHLFTTNKEVDQYNNARSLKHCQQPIALVETDH